MNFVVLTTEWIQIESVIYQRDVFNIQKKKEHQHFENNVSKRWLCYKSVWFLNCQHFLVCQQIYVIQTNDSHRLIFSSNIFFVQVSCRTSLYGKETFHGNDETRCNNRIKNQNYGSEITSRIILNHFLYEMILCFDNTWVTKRKTIPMCRSFKIHGYYSKCLKRLYYTEGILYLNILNFSLGSFETFVHDFQRLLRIARYSLPAKYPIFPSSLKTVSFYCLFFFDVFS